MGWIFTLLDNWQYYLEIESICFQINFGIGLYTNECHIVFLDYFIQRCLCFQQLIWIDIFKFSFSVGYQFHARATELWNLMARYLQNWTDRCL